MTRAAPWHGDRPPKALVRTECSAKCRARHAGKPADRLRWFPVTWTKLGDEWPIEARDLTDAEYRTQVDALCWSNLRLLDSLVPKRDVRRFAETDDPGTAVKGLVVKGWWENRGDSWYIGLRFPEWQLEREQVEARKADNRLRQKRSRLHKVGDHSLCERCAAVTRDVTREITP